MENAIRPAEEAPARADLELVRPVAQAYEHTFDATAAERAALAPDDLVVIYTDVMSAASQARSAAVRAAKYEAEIARISVVPDLRRQVIRFADAAAGSHLRYVNADEAQAPTVPYVAELRRARDVLLQDVKALVGHGLAKPKRLEHLTRKTGHRSIVVDVLILTSGLLGTWKEIEGRTASSRAELEQFHVMAKDADAAIGIREAREKMFDEAADARQRAFTLLDKLYRELERVMTFILWWEGKEAIARAVPRFQKGRSKRGEEARIEVAGGVGGAAVETGREEVIVGGGAPGHGGA